MRSEGASAALATPPAAIAAGEAHDVAFTVFGWNGDFSTVRLYLDGEPVAESNDE